MYDVIIIGAGPAGLTSAIYLKRANKKVLVLESKSYGGQIINAKDIENYPGYLHISGYDLADAMYKQALELGVEIKLQEVIEIKPTKVKKVITKEKEYLTKSIIIATGCENRKLNLLHEDKLVGRGVSYCAICDGNFYKNKTVAVVGGGNSAIDDAMYLSDISRKVYLIHRRDLFRADNMTVELLKKKENVEFVLNSNIVKLNGENKLESVEIVNDKGTITLNIDGLFVAIGQVPNTKIFKNIIDLNNDYVKSRNTLTNRKGIFVAGDVREKEIRQLVTATCDGAMAAVA